MKTTMRCITLLFLLLLAACGSSKSAATPVPTATPALALPVVAPMQARDRLLHDLDVEKQKARDRSTTLQGVIDQDK